MPCHLRTAALAAWLGLAALYGGPAAAAGIRVAPVTVEITADGGHAGIWLYNDGEAPWLAQARLYRWHQRDGRDLLEATGELRASPARIAIPPHGRQLLRLVRPGPAPGRQEAAYRLVVEQEPAAGERTALRYSVPVFAAPSAASPPPADTLAVTTGAGGLSIRNPGARRVRIADLALVDAHGRRHALVEGLAGYVLAGQERTWQLPLDAGTLFGRIDELPEAPLAHSR